MSFVSHSHPSSYSTRLVQKGNQYCILITKCDFNVGCWSHQFRLTRVGPRSFNTHHPHHNLQGSLQRHTKFSKFPRWIIYEDTPEKFTSPEQITVSWLLTFPWNHKRVESSTSAHSCGSIHRLFRKKVGSTERPSSPGLTQAVKPSVLSKTETDNNLDYPFWLQLSVSFRVKMLMAAAHCCDRLVWLYSLCAYWSFRYCLVFV